MLNHLACLQVCLSPGAWRIWLIHMTASSPTPQQQSRWKGRRVLAAALIPLPGAYPPKHTPAALWSTLLSGNASERTTAESSDLPLKLCPTNKCQSHAGSVSQPRDPDSELGRFAPRNLLVKHSEPAPGTGMCRHVRSLKGREQIPQWGAATGGNILWAVPPSALPFRLLLRCRRVATRRRQTHVEVVRTERRKAGLWVSSVKTWHCIITASIKASNVLAWNLILSYHILSYMLIEAFSCLKMHSDQSIFIKLFSISVYPCKISC